MIRTDRRGEVVSWTIDRPSAKNALDHRTIADLTAAIRTSDARAGVLTGTGDVFVAGGDLYELRDKLSAADAAELTDAGYALTQAIAEAPFPVLCALSGAAIGGGAELAVACDLRVAGPLGRLSFMQVRMGVTTSWGTVSRLTALVGAGAAARLLYTARSVGPVEAKEIGLVDEVSDDPLATARAWAADIARGPASVVAELKVLLRSASDPSPEERARERAAFIRTWSGPEHQRAVEAYFARRQPRDRG